MRQYWIGLFVTCISNCLLVQLLTYQVSLCPDCPGVQPPSRPNVAPLPPSCHSSPAPACHEVAHPGPAPPLGGSCGRVSRLGHNGGHWRRSNTALAEPWPPQVAWRFWLLGYKASHPLISLTERARISLLLQSRADSLKMIENCKCRLLHNSWY